MKAHGALAVHLHAPQVDLVKLIEIRRHTFEVKHYVVVVCRDDGRAENALLHAVVWNKCELRIARKEIVWDERNMRWEAMQRTQPDSYGFPEGFFGIVTFVTLCAQSDGNSVGASVRAPSFTTPTRRAGQ